MGDAIDKCEAMCKTVCDMIDRESFKELGEYLATLVEPIEASEMYTAVVMARGYAEHPEVKQAYEDLEDRCNAILGKPPKDRSKKSDNSGGPRFIYRPDGFKIE